jgi:hypothetical protein
MGAKTTLVVRVRIAICRHNPTARPFPGVACASILNSADIGPHEGTGIGLLTEERLGVGPGFLGERIGQGSQSGGAWAVPQGPHEPRHAIRREQRHKRPQGHHRQERSLRRERVIVDVNEAVPLVEKAHRVQREGEERLADGVLAVDWR